MITQPTRSHPGHYDRQARPWFSLLTLIMATGCGDPDRLAPVHQMPATDRGQTDSGQPIVLTDLLGKAVQPLPADSGRIRAFITMRTDCPIANRYAPEIRSIAEQFADQIEFTLVYPTATETADQVRQHVKDYQLPAALLDPRQQFVDRYALTVTPEVAVFDTANRLVYRGRIDNRFVSFGQMRARATEHDLIDCLSALVRGAETHERPFTKAVGCYIESDPE